MIPDFVLMNSGTTDVIITAIVYGFKYDKSYSAPAQRIEWNEGESLLISPGKGIHGKVSFTEEFTTVFAKCGTKSMDTIGSYEHSLHLDISWVQYDGKQYKKSVPIGIMVFALNGRIGGYKPVERQETDLYHE